METETNIALSAELSIFSTKLNSMYVHEGKGYKVLIIPDLSEDAPMVSLKEMVNDILKLAGSNSTSEREKLENDITEKIGNNNQENKTEVKFQLKMLYLYIDTTKGDDNKILEYAFNFNIDTTSIIPAELSKIVQVNHIGISIWNTKRKNILENMSIVDIDSYLGLSKITTETETK